MLLEVIDLDSLSMILCRKSAMIQALTLLVSSSFLTPTLLSSSIRHMSNWWLEHILITSIKCCNGISVCYRIHGRIRQEPLLESPIFY